MNVTEMKKVLTNGNFDVQGGEIKTVCRACGKHFLVNLGIMAEAMVKHGAADCSSCGTKTLRPVYK